jgi:hypothetical protein
MASSEFDYKKYLALVKADKKLFITVDNDDRDHGQLSAAEQV